MSLTGMVPGQHVGPGEKKPHPEGCGFPALPEDLAARAETRLPEDQWNCSSSVEPVSAVTDEAPPWIVVVTSSK